MLLKTIKLKTIISVLSVAILLPMSGVAKAEPMIGEIRMFAGHIAPRGWAFCDGSLLNIEKNGALFTVINTIYGGNGITTFALPDLRGRVPVHAGRGPGLSDYRLGQWGGAETAIIDTSHLPAHTHAFNATIGIPVKEGNADTNVVSEAEGLASQAALGRDTIKLLSKTTDKTLNAGVIYGTTTSAGDDSSSSNSQRIDIRQPYLGIHYIIALEGVYPSR
jgi:microcystin-dependent protein